jgi:hypothetical protein
VDVKDHEHRRLIFNYMKAYLTPEDKTFLKRVSNYLNSLGMTRGYINFEMDTYDSRLKSDDIEWNRVTRFDNNYSAMIPEKLKPIIRKIVEGVDNSYIENDTDLDFAEVEDDDVNYQGYEIIINTQDRDITLIHTYSYYARGGENSILFDSEEDTKRFDEWMETIMDEVEVPSDGILSIDFNGGGDSGYITNTFQPTGDVVPDIIENWCYNQLEEHYGGWEINEGSDGSFIFNFNDSTIELNLTYNEEYNVSNTLYEESFG